jgi:hypothetical protein
MRGTTNSCIDESNGTVSFYLFEGTFEAIDLQSKEVILSDVTQFLVSGDDGTRQTIRHYPDNASFQLNEVAEMLFPKQNITRAHGLAPVTRREQQAIEREEVRREHALSYSPGAPDEEEESTVISEGQVSQAVEQKVEEESVVATKKTTQKI